MLSTLKLFKKHNLDFHIDSVGSTVTGWVRNSALPTQRVVVELLVDGEVVTETAADTFRQDLLEAGKGDGKFGFQLTLPRHLQERDRPKISLREKGKSIPFYKSKSFLKNTLNAEDSCQFHIDQEGAEFVGWIRKPSAPTHRVVIELLADGDVVAETVANVFRQDLLDAGKGDGTCGFSVRLPSHLWGQDHLEVSLREKGNDSPFHKTTLFLAVTSDREEFQFHIDTEETEFSGWVIELSAPTRRLVVELLANGEVVAETVADMFRQDLLEAGKGDGACGFKVSIPDSLYDGHAHTLALRAKGAKDPFYELGPRRLVEPSCVFDGLSPFGISGTCRLPKGDSTGIDIQVMLAGEPLARARPDRLNQFDLYAKATSVETALSMIEPGSNATLDLEVQANGFTVCRVEKTVGLSRSRKLALMLETLTKERLELQLFELKSKPTDRMTIQIGQQTIWESATGPVHTIDLDFRSLCLSDGTHEVRLLSHSASKAEIVEAIWEIDFERWDVTVEIDNNRVLGAITDSWDSNQNPAVELLIDDRACGVAMGKLHSQHDSRQFDVTFPIAARFRDGKPHRASLRLVGTDRQWPERGAMFKAGSPETQTLARVEFLQADGRDRSRGQQVSGFVVAAWDADAVFEVSLVQDEEVLARQTADKYSPQLDAEHVLPKARGFSFDVSDLGVDEGGGPLKIVASLSDHKVFERFVSFTPNTPFTVSDPGYGRRGICIVINDPYASLENLEETRALLLIAASLKRATDTVVTVALAYSAAESARGVSVRDWITDLVGTQNAQDLSDVAFVYLPSPVLPSTVFGDQEIAYRLDLWVRSCAFAFVLGPSGNGVMAYCGNSRREGLLTDRTKIFVLLEGFAVEALLNGEHLLDDPGLLNTEALERLALRTADELFVHRPQALSVATGLWPNASQKILTFTPEIGPAIARPMGRLPDSPKSWFVVAGPMSTAAGVGVVCDALDRLAREFGAKDETIGIAFVGPEGDLRGKQAGDYIRERSQAWPFELRVHLDLTFDSMRDALADFAGRGLGLVLQGHEGSAWTALLQAIGVGVVDLLEKEQCNPTAMADRLKKILNPFEAHQARPEEHPRISDYLKELLTLPEAEVCPPNGSAFPSTLPPISVCISHFNRPTLLRQTCESLRACQYPELEVVIVDDGSRAFGVSKELDEIQEEFSDLFVNVVKQPNNYLGAARNTAVRNSKYELVVFMDDDNIARPEMLHGLVEAMYATDADIVTARFAFFDETDVVEENVSIPARLGVPLTPDLGVGVFSNGFGDANMLVRRKAFEQVGGFTEDYGVGHEDWEFFARARMNGVSHCLSNRVLFHYRVGAESMLRGRERMERDMLRNMRAYAETPGTSEQSIELYRVALLAQGLIKRWDQPMNTRLPVARPGLEVARRLAFGRVAVIMRTKDRPILLERAIDSVLGQTMTDWTLVIVNDGGDPEPVKALLDARKRALQSRAILINNPISTGMENASNAGITNSISEYVIIHDDDDAWDADFLKHCVHHLDSTSPEVGGVVTHATVVVEDIEGSKVVERSRHLFKPMQSVDLAKMSVENQFPPISFLFRRSSMETVGQFDGTLPVLGDWDFHLRMAKRFQIDVIPEPLAFYHHRTAGTTNRYGNTVIAQKYVHQIQRAKYINRAMRSELESPLENTSGHLLYQGELHREVTESISDIRHHLHWLEKMLKDRAEHACYIEDMIEGIDEKIATFSGSQN